MSCQYTESNPSQFHHNLITISSQSHHNLITISSRFHHDLVTISSRSHHDLTTIPSRAHGTGMVRACSWVHAVQGCTRGCMCMRMADTSMWPKEHAAHLCSSACSCAIHTCVCVQIHARLGLGMWRTSVFLDFFAFLEGDCTASVSIVHAITCSTCMRVCIGAWAISIIHACMAEEEEEESWSKPGRSQ